MPNALRGPMPNALRGPMPNAQCPIPNSQCPIPNAQFPIPNAQFPITAKLTAFSSSQLLVCERPQTSTFGKVPLFAAT